MLFNSIQFLLFFPLVCLGYFVIPKGIRYIWLLIASYFFYMCWNVEYALLILASTLVTYAGGLIIGRINKTDGNEKSRIIRKKWTVAICLIINFGILFFFKYFGFAADLIEKLFKGVGVNISIPEFDIILPVGISFYTFQAVGYIIDVYRGTTRPEGNVLRYALFVSFFPQLVAGPIERSGNLLKQLYNPSKFDYDRFRDGLLIMLWGFFLKLVIADRIALFVDTVYGASDTYTGVYLVIASILFAFQIYCDFAGYTGIAIGAAKILGISLCENFDAPYMATSVAAFWRRWHISLTSWFKDYLYIPLGGSKKGRVRKYINQMIVFVTSGLWHGADLSFMLWGFLNGFYQVIGDVLKPVRDGMINTLKLKREAFIYKLSQIFITFVLVDFSWIFFRARGIRHGLSIVKSILTTFNINVLTDGSLFNCGLDMKNFILLLIALIVLLFVDICKTKRIVIRERLMKKNFFIRSLFIVFAVMFILIFGKYGPAYDAASFIYFQF